MMLLQPKTEDLANENSSPRVVNSLMGKERNGKDLKWNEIRDKYILVDFWASWHPQSVAEQRFPPQSHQGFKEGKVHHLQFFLGFGQGSLAKSIGQRYLAVETNL